MKTISFAIMFLILTSCGANKSNGSLAKASQTSPDIAAADFVAALNNVDPSGSPSKLIERGQFNKPNVDGSSEMWFIIWDGKNSAYNAVSLSYIRKIVYSDYYSNNNSVVSEFRQIRDQDALTGTHDFTNGRGYEIVDPVHYGEYYEGRSTHYLYEDELPSTDVSLEAKTLENTKIIKKAAAVSYTYNLSIESSFSMVILAKRIEKILGDRNGELTADDKSAIFSDFKSLIGIDMSELESSMNNSQSSQTKADLLLKVANKLGTSSQNLEQKILPEIFGIKI